MRSFELSRKTHTKQKLNESLWEGEPEQTQGRNPGIGIITGSGNTDG